MVGKRFNRFAEVGDAFRQRQMSPEYGLDDGMSKPTRPPPGPN